MRVGVVVGGYGPEAGGGYTFETDIVQAIVDLAHNSRHEFVLICPPEYADFGPMRSRIAQVEMIVYRRPGPWQRAVDMLQRRSAFVRGKWRKRGRIERLLREAGAEFAWFISPGADFVDTPYVTIVWDLMHRTEPWFPEVSERGEWDSRESAYAWFLRRATAIIVGTEVGREQLTALYQIPAERIHVAPHPTPTFVLRRDAPVEDSMVLEKYGLESEFIIYPAQFWPHKNHVNLLKGVNLLRARVGTVPHVVFVGSDKGNRGYVAQCVGDLGLTDLVHFLGFIPTSDLIVLYRQALALLYPSFGGPENLPPLEAFALGCPVVAADIPGASEQLGDAALLVAPDDPEAIASAIDRVREDSALRQALVERGTARAKRWTGRDFVNRVFSILDDFEAIRSAWAPGNR